MRYEINIRLISSNGKEIKNVVIPSVKSGQNTLIFLVFYNFLLFDFISEITTFHCEELPNISCIRDRKESKNIIKFRANQDPFLIATLSTTSKIIQIIKINRLLVS